MKTAEHALANGPTKDLWKNIGICDHHGINTPLFSLRSKQSGGIGEFTDLIPLIKFCKKINFDVIQLLPLNDTGRDTSPYNAISAYALNPLYLNLITLPGITTSPSVDQVLLTDTLQLLNQSQRISFSKVRQCKKHLLEAYFKDQWATISKNPSYQDFEKRYEWLKGYALFKVLKAKNQHRSWESWPEDLKDPLPGTLERLYQEYAEEIHFHSFVQYLCFQQFKAVKTFATEQRVWIKGDIPILISRDSADVWLNRSLFEMAYSAGAPPDQYSATGQNWGFPVYNWQALEETNYNWWRERLLLAEHFYHLYRIDHIVGFFRIWAIPINRGCKSGGFLPADEGVWIEHGRKILSMMLETCPLLPIGEDLGTVPKEVRQCMKEMGICGTKVMRWERLWDEGDRFIPGDEYIEESMTTVSTHDSETLQQWWQGSAKDRSAYTAFKGWPFSKKLSLKHHTEILRDSHHTKSLFHINLLQEYLALIPDMTWPDLRDERINLPGTISDDNWSYRYRPYLEDILCNSALKEVMKTIIAT